MPAQSGSRSFRPCVTMIPYIGGLDIHSSQNRSSDYSSLPPALAGCCCLSKSSLRELPASLTDTAILSNYAKNVQLQFLKGSSHFDRKLC